jgi:hypothetical protein
VHSVELADELKDHLLLCRPRHVDDYLHGFSSF